MFSESKTKSKESRANSHQNIIAQGTTITGDLKSTNGFRIDGTVEGNLITDAKVVVGKDGFIKGTIQASDAYFEGKFDGKLTLTGTLTLKATAVITGEVLINKLDVEPGATFNTTCVMKSTLKELKSDAKKIGKSA